MKEDKKLELIELEESFDPSTEMYIEVRRRNVARVWVSESSSDSGLYEKMFDVVGDLEAIQALVISKTTLGNGATSPKVLQNLDQFFAAKGSISTEWLKERYAALGLEVRETQ